MLLSGGLDSYLVWRSEVWPEAVWFNIGTVNNARERERLLLIQKRWGGALIHESLALSLGRFEQPSGYVPYRNLLFILHANLLFPRRDLLIGEIMEWQADKNAAFYREAEKLVKSLGRDQIKIRAPLAGVTRTEAVAAFLRNGGDPDELTTLTYSCMLNASSHCGFCASCMNRWIAFKNNGIEERMLSRPTLKRWLDNAREQRSIANPLRAVMYARRWHEAMTAFKGE
jgi:7-cyano-7-deazaguanine synthase in queuosine biosynthesis